MIDYTEFREQVEDWIGSNFSTVPIQYENTRINKDEFISLIDNNTNSRSMGMNETVYTVEGFLIIQIHTKLGLGSVKARQIASELSTLLSSKQLSGVKLETPVLTSAGPVEGTNSYLHNLTIQYQYFYGQDESSN